jgi:hypothetical protein
MRLGRRDSGRRVADGARVVRAGAPSDLTPADRVAYQTIFSAKPSNWRPEACAALLLRRFRAVGDPRLESVSWKLLHAPLQYSHGTRIRRDETSRRAGGGGAMYRWKTGTALGHSG